LAPGAEQRVWEQFAQLEGSDRKGGTGLGLAIVAGFAAAMGVEPSARNREDGAGAVFALRFPPALLVRPEEETV
jgi:two-component system sensor histidine kinase KdpD